MKKTFSEYKDSPSYMSDEQLNELKISRGMWNEWCVIMNELLKATRKEIKDNYIKMEDNSIIIRDIKIEAFFYNKAWIEVQISKGTIEILKIRYCDNLIYIINIVLLCLHQYVKDILKPKSNKSTK